MTKIRFSYLITNEFFEFSGFYKKLKRTSGDKNKKKKKIHSPPSPILIRFFFLSKFFLIEGDTETFRFFLSDSETQKLMADNTKCVNKLFY